MSLVPFLMNEMLREFEHPLYGQNFSTELFPSNLVLPSISAKTLPLQSSYLRPWRFIASSDSGVSKLSHDKDGLNISLDVQEFKPEELKVKVIDDYVVIEGKHKERSDEHGLISRQFTRRYKLPEDVDKAALESSLSSDGVLQIHAPLATILPAVPVFQVPIIYGDNKPALKQAQNKPTKKRENVKVLEAITYKPL